MACYLVYALPGPVHITCLPCYPVYGFLLDRPDIPCTRWYRRIWVHACRLLFRVRPRHRAIRASLPWRTDISCTARDLGPGRYRAPRMMPCYLVYTRQAPASRAVKCCTAKVRGVQGHGLIFGVRPFVVTLQVLVVMARLLSCVRRS